MAKYPEGSRVEVTYSPYLERFTAELLGPEEEGKPEESLICFHSSRLSDALESLAFLIRKRYE